MTASRTNTASAWLDRKENSDWAPRIAETARLVVDAMRAGQDAEYEYKRLTRHGVKPQDASAAALKRLAR